MQPAALIAAAVLLLAGLAAGQTIAGSDDCDGCTDGTGPCIFRIATSVLCAAYEDAATE